MIRAGRFNHILELRESLDSVAANPQYKQLEELLRIAGMSSQVPVDYYQGLLHFLNKRFDCDIRTPEDRRSS